MAAVARLRDECRAAKEALSVDTDVIIPVLLPNVQTEVRLTRSEFEEMVEPRIGATIAALRRAARSAGLELSEVDRILLVGGSSRIPLVRQRVREETQGQIYLDAHPKYAIALGAAIAADLDLGTTTTARLTGQAAPPVAATSEPQTESAAVVEPDHPAPAEIEQPPVQEPAPAPVIEPEPAEPAATITESAPPAVQPAPEPPPSALQAALDEAIGTETVPPQRVAPEPVADSAAITDHGEPAPDSLPAAPERRPVAAPDTAPIQVDPQIIASSQWQDGIALSPLLVGSLVVVALVSALTTFLLLSLVAG